MTKRVRACTPDQSALEIAQMLADEHVGSVPVVESFDNPKLLGVITDRDLVLRVMAKGLDPLQTHAAGVMSKDLVTCLPSDDVDEAADRMMRNQVRRIYIAGRDGRLHGVIAQADLASRTDDRNRTAQVLERISQPDAPHPPQNP